MSKKLTGVVVAILVAIVALFVLSPSGAASATQAFKPYDTTQTWYAPSPASVKEPFAVPQTTTVLECGGIKQVDQYTIDTPELEQKYQALISGGVLRSPADDAPFHPRGVVTALPDCTPTAVFEPRIQDYISCDGGAFVLDNIASTESVIYVVNGTEFVVPAGQAVHTDANGTLIQPVNGQYVVTAGDKSWTFPAKDDCVVVPPVTEEPPVEQPPVEEPPVIEEPPVVVVPPVDTTPVVDTPVAEVPVVLTPVENEEPTHILAAESVEQPEALAYTGTNENFLIAVAIAAGLAILAGVGLIIARVRRGPVKAGVIE